MSQLIVISQEELAGLIREQLAPIYKLLTTKKEPEFPKRRSEIMEKLGVKDIRTFRKRAQELGIKAAGEIGQEPAYYLSHFFEPNDKV